ncbi:hypothetical protein DM01DRAFT_305530 [Hesseltinella vesiculosa]|uniref:Uncharacterized protein n=1 Tax=Hesseltinella vesiculosa TaxID=101127 RepID=A0A1X2GRR7_9FUNG|nr:hypothetical protein DM01DRAFT_305530 [Hesseltinella vesiculosa]
MHQMREHYLTKQLRLAQEETNQLRQHLQDKKPTPSLLENPRPSPYPIPTSPYQEEQHILRHTRAQLGLIEFLEGEADIRAALSRFKQLLLSTC